MASEVLLLLRQILPVLAQLHDLGVVHGDVNPRHLLLRRSDGLTVLLDGGRVQRQGASQKDSFWRDLRHHGITALMLLGGTAGVDGGWPEGLELEMEFRQLLERLLSESQERRFGQASEVLKALESIVLPEYTKESRAKVRISRAKAREQEAEGRLWPVVIALGLSALLSSALGWFMLQRTSPAETAPVRVVQQPSVSLPPAGLDQRQQLFSRLRALQVDRSWFFNVIYGFYY